METRWSYTVMWTTLCFVLGEKRIPRLHDGNLHPVLTKDMNNLELSESTPIGTVVYTLQGIDPEDMPIRYSLMGTDKFAVDPYTGNVTLIKPLDREEQGTIEFLVSVEDDYLDRIQNLVQPVTVRILDENDTPPQFEKNRYEVYVNENHEACKPIMDSIEVHDEDIVGNFLKVGCKKNKQWPEACKTFAVVPINVTRRFYVGMLVLKKPLDYKERQFYRYEMFADDGRFKTSAHIDIKVVDVQNSPPVFLSSLSAAVPEDVPMGTLVLVLKAKDGDEVYVRDVVLELIHNPMGFFKLDSTTGELRTARPLERGILADPSSPINLAVRASEMVNGSRLISESTSTTVNVAITIRKVDDGIIDPHRIPMRYRLLGNGKMPVVPPRKFTV